MSVGHYENFPVGSFLLPKHLRLPVHAIYRFARTADDIADEGEDTASLRLLKLAKLKADIDLISDEKKPNNVLMQDLFDKAISPYSLPLQPFYDLLSAFSQDVQKTRYETFSELMDYCSRSANPVGRLMLALYSKSSEQNVILSDNICSALQIINFWQDIALDWKKSRVYIPQEDLRHFAISESQIAKSICDEAWKSMMLYQIERSRKMLKDGSSLGKILSGRIGLELRAIIMGAERILQKLENCNGDVFRQRPLLKASDWCYVFYKAILN